MIRSNSPRDILENISRIAGGRTTLDRIAKKYAVAPLAIVGRERSVSVNRARHEWLSILRDTLDMSLPEIGDLMGMNHTTVLVACRKRSRRLAAEYACKP